MTPLHQFETDIAAAAGSESSCDGASGSVTVMRAPPISQLQAATVSEVAILRVSGFSRAQIGGVIFGESAIV